MTTTIDLSTFGAGTYTFEDDGIAGNNRSQVRDQNGNIVAFFNYDPAENVVISGAGQTLVLNMTDSLGNASFAIGTFNDNPGTPGYVSPNPDAILVNTITSTGTMYLNGGTIAEFGSDAGVDIVAAQLSMRAGSGIGIAANAIETQAAKLQGETDTGGIFLEQFGDTQIASINGRSQRGLVVVNTGDLNLIVHGTLTGAGPKAGLNGGDLWITAMGATADINLSISAPTAAQGNVHLTADRDIILHQGMNFGLGAIIQAGRNINAIGFQSDGVGDVLITAGGNFSANATALHGNVVVTAGGNVDGGFFAHFGGVTINAGDNFLLSGTIAADALIIRVDTDGTDPGVGGTLDLDNNDVSGWGSQPLPIPLILAGSGDNDILFGTRNAEQFDGGAGADRMIGAGGNDIYIVDNAGDQVMEGIVPQTGANQGYDVVYAKVDYTLAPGTSVESLVALDYASTAFIALTGNEIANYLLGNAGANQLNGGAGADLLEGRGGNDIYVVDNVGDLAIEYAGGGIDAVYTTISYTLTEGYEVESLVALNYAATTALDLTGNSIANYLIGNDGANVLNGGAGSDALEGRAGADTFVFANALGANNVDYLGDFSSVDDTIQLDHNVFAGLGLGVLNPNAFFAGTAAHDADDRIIYDQAAGRLLFDADGAGGNAAVLFAYVGGAPAISASDFVVV